MENIRQLGCKNRFLRAWALMLSFVLFNVGTGFAQQVPAKPQAQSILILNAKAHLGNGEVIENSAIGFENGKLTLVADATTVRVDQSKYQQVVKASGKDVYPGMIAVDSKIGLTEIDAVRATRDNQEVGYYNPNIRSIIAYNTDSRITPTIRSNGVLLAQVAPRGGRISGTASVVELEGWNWEDAVYLKDNGIFLNWPQEFRWSGWWSANPGMKKNEKYAEQVSDLRDYFLEAKAYMSSQPKAKNLRFEAMRDLMAGKASLFVRVNDAKPILEAIDLFKELKIKLVLVGAREVDMVLEEVKRNNIAVVLQRTQRTPRRDDQDINHPYKLPAILQKRGIEFCITDQGAWEQRTLPFQAGQAISYGLPYEEGVKAVTLSTAKILGIDQTVGSLEVGKDATLFISQGDVFDMRTSKVEKAFVRGKEIDLDNKQKALYRKFTKKYESE